MKITFLGTGTSGGVPMIGCKCNVCKSANPKDNRLRTSVLVEDAGHTFVVDSGPDFRQQMLRNDVQNIDAILFTHEHKDHIAGLDDIRPYNYIHKKAIDVYAESRVINALKREFAYIFSMYKYPGIPKIVLHEIQNREFTILGHKIIPIRALHMDLPVFGFRFGDFTYMTDANFIADEDLELMKGTKILVINALRNESHPSHFSLNEAIEISYRANPEKTYFTHMSHQIGLHDDVNIKLPANMFLAYDNQQIEI